MLALSNEENEILVPDELGALKEGLISAFPSTPAQFPIRNKLRCPARTNEAAARGAPCWIPPSSALAAARGKGARGRQLNVWVYLPRGVILWLLCWVGRSRIMAAAVLARLALAAPACERGWWWEPWGPLAH